MTESATITRTRLFHADPLAEEFATHGHTFTDPAFRSYRTPAFTACRFDAITLIGSDGIALHAGAAIPDTISHIMTWAPGSATESFEAGRSVTLRAAMPLTNAAGAGFVIGFSAAWRNYAHWIQECLPKLFGFCRLRQHNANLKLILPPLAPGSFQEQTLALLGIEATATVTIGHDEATHFHDVWVMTHADIWSVPPMVPIAAAALLAAGPPSPTTHGARIYLHRETPGRKIVNFHAVAAAVERHGFEIVAFEDVKLPTQIAIMRRARFVIGEHGAGLANIVFCAPGAGVLELFNPANPQPAHWSVASVCHHRYGYVAGQHVPIADAPTPNWNSPYRVTLERLEDAMQAMGVC